MYYPVEFKASPYEFDVIESRVHPHKRVLVDAVYGDKMATVSQTRVLSRLPAERLFVEFVAGGPEGRVVGTETAARSGWRLSRQGRVCSDNMANAAVAAVKNSID